MNHSPDLLELLQRQRQLLDELLALGQLQLQAIEQGRMTELITLLADKQPLLTQLHEQAGLLRERSQQLAIHHDGDDPYRVRCRQQKQLVDQQYDQLLELERQAELQLTASREQIAGRLAETASAIQAAAAYQRMSPGGAGGPATGGSLDLSSGD